MDFQKQDIFDDKHNQNYALQSNWQAGLELLAKQCHNNKHYPTLSALQQALWKTHIADEGFTSAGEHIRASPDMEEGYRLIGKAHVRSSMKVAKVLRHDGRGEGGVSARVEILES